METLAVEFEQALSRIQVDAEPAQEAQKEVRAVLEGNAQLVDWGIDTILIGSYRRNTGIHPAKDVDVFAKLLNLNTSTTPSKVFDAVRDEIQKHYGQRAKARSRSVKIQFPDGFSADVVPAVSSGTNWAIPAKDPELWANSEKRWHATNPERLIDLTSVRNEEPKVGGRGAYVPVVKLMRQAREHHLKHGRPGGLYLEFATFWAFERGSEFGRSFAEIFAYALRSASTQFATGQVLLDPALGTPYTPAPMEGDLERVAAKFLDLAHKAEEALRLDRCAAALNWRYILGENTDGHCFPLPDGCDEKGQAVKSITAVTAVGPNEARPFA